MNVCTPVPVLVTIERSIPPDVDEAKVCEATLLPFNEVILPPIPPASSPQKKVPLSQRSFFVTELHADSDAP